MSCTYNPNDRTLMCQNIDITSIPQEKNIIENFATIDPCFTNGFVTQKFDNINCYRSKQSVGGICPKNTTYNSKYAITGAPCAETPYPYNCAKNPNYPKYVPPPKGSVKGSCSN
jgi:hypothetical protein